VKRIATIDIGTNTALLLIADLDEKNRRVLTVENHQRIIRLGKGVDANRKILPESIARLTACFAEYQSLMRAATVNEIYAVATSAVRDASNRDEVLRAVREQNGITIELLSGEMEAELTFVGTLAGWNNLPASCLALDIGGGSTELILGNTTGIREKISVDAGAVRLTERFFTSQPPKPSECKAARDFVVQAFAPRLGQFVSGREHLYGVAGTIVTLAQIAQHLPVFDAEKLHGYALQFSDVEKLHRTFANQTTDEVIASGVERGRADVITGGSLVLMSLMELLGAPSVTVSIQGLRYGVAMRELMRELQRYLAG
jgi:exopolyphosphatase / guanosine-5'-triphosphate,3'-diphosphate pyrophosphatase